MKIGDSILEYYYGDDNVIHWKFTRPWGSEERIDHGTCKTLGWMRDEITDWLLSLDQISLLKEFRERTRCFIGTIGKPGISGTSGYSGSGEDPDELEEKK